MDNNINKKKKSSWCKCICYSILIFIVSILVALFFLSQRKSESDLYYETVKDIEQLGPFYVRYPWVVASVPRIDWNEQEMGIFIILRFFKKKKKNE